MTTYTVPPRVGTVDAPDLSRRIELERADAARGALEEAANMLETRGGNEVYRQAWRKAADLIRAIAYRG